MNIVLVREKLKEAVDAVSRVANTQEGLPVLKNILIEANEKGVVLSATNLEVGIRYSIVGKVIEKGSLTAPAQILAQMVGGLQEDRINLISKDAVLELSTDSYQASIQGIPSSEFPIIPTIKNREGFIELDTDMFKSGLEQTLAATQFSELRPELNSVLFYTENNRVVLVGTDSFRLAEKTLPEGGVAVHTDKEVRCLIPIKTTQELLRIMKDGGKIKVYEDGSQMLFISDHFEFVSRLIDGSFPDYKSVVPNDFDIESVVSKEEFVQAVKLTSVLSSSVNEISLEVQKSKKGIEISSSESGIGENTYVFPAKVKKADVDLPVRASFNWRYLLEGLRAVEGNEIFFGISGDNRPAIIRSSQSSSSYFYILMPILKE